MGTCNWWALGTKCCSLTQRKSKFLTWVSGKERWKIKSEKNSVRATVKQKNEQANK